MGTGQRDSGRHSPGCDPDRSDLVLFRQLTGDVIMDKFVDVCIGLALLMVGLGMMVLCFAIANKMFFLEM
jgi:hypothetical protein